MVWKIIGLTKNVIKPYGCSVWKAIRNLWPKMQIRNKVRIGNGQKTSFFGMTSGAGLLTMKQQHPELYTLSQQQEATVAMMWTGQGWHRYLRRYLNDWEIGRITEFYNSVASFNNLNDELDRLEWNTNSKGIFSVYRELNVEVVKERDWSWKMIWKQKIPYKINCFI